MVRLLEGEGGLFKKDGRGETGMFGGEAESPAGDGAGLDEEQPEAFTTLGGEFVDDVVDGAPDELRVVGGDGGDDPERLVRGRAAIVVHGQFRHPVPLDRS